MITIAIANQKGGTGKTATAHNLAAVICDRARVLLVDCDPQGSLTNSVMESAPAGATLADLMTGKARPADVIYHAGALDIIPSSVSLASVELELVTRLGRENVLRRALATVSGYDVCIIDCGPSLSILTINALTAAHGVIVPTQPQAVDLRGLALFMNTITQVKELNPALEIIGILPTFYDARLNHHNEAIEAMTAAGLPVMKVRIKRTVKIAEAAGLSRSLAQHEPRNLQNKSYTELGKVVIKWLKSKQ